MSENANSSQTTGSSDLSSGAQTLNPSTANEVPDLPASDIELLKKKGFIIGKRLNSGSFSIVCKALMNNKAVAVKIIDLSKTSDDYRTKFLPRELYSMTKLKHPHIITLHKIFTLQETRIYVFMDLADGGDILDLIKTGPLSELKAKPLYRGVADALRYIHEKGFAHRDIKCENILLNQSRSVAKIADFGFSRTCFNNTTGERLLSATYCGSAAYAAPEVLKIKPYNAMISDVWSMGIVLYVLVNCRLPFNENNLKQMVRRQLQSDIEYKPNLSILCKQLIAHHLDPDIKTRFTMKQVLRHKWFV